MKSGDLIKKLSIFSLVVVSSLVIAIQAMENEVEENRKQKKELDLKFLMAHKISCSEKRSTQLSDIRAEGAVVALFFRNHQEEHMEDYNFAFKENRERTITQPNIKGFQGLWCNTSLIILQFRFRY